jgi:hypothetical protein
VVEIIQPAQNQDPEENYTEWSKNKLNFVTQHARTHCYSTLLGTSHKYLYMYECIDFVEVTPLS